MAENDLHLHTTCSDGRLAPSELVQLCAERGLKVLAISDHDSTEGIEEALDAARAFPELEVIPGVELSTDVPGSEIHMLGYFVDHRDADFQRVLRRFRDDRQQRARRMVERLNELGIEISWGRVEELSKGGAIGRPHIAQAMVEAGYVKYPKDAFDRYIGRNGVAYAERVKLTPVEAINILVSHGALPVMAHPTYAASKSDREGVATLRESSQISKRRDWWEWKSTMRITPLSSRMAGRVGRCAGADPMRRKRLSRLRQPRRDRARVCWAAKRVRGETQGPPFSWFPSRSDIARR